VGGEKSPPIFFTSRTSYEEPKMGRTFKERLELLDDIKECLISDRNFYLRRKDWGKVFVIRQKLKDHAEQVAKVSHLAAKKSA
jgi:hypothetical protein